MAQLNFAAAIAALGGGDALVRLANEARPPSSYLLNTILPERNMPDYAVRSGGITIRPTMAGLAAMDSPYPPVGLIDVANFLADTAKLASNVTLTEQAQRHIQALLALMSDGDAESATVQEALNFYNALVIQPHLDTAEWLRGQALTGEIDWTFNQKSVTVDYGFPTANKLTARTTLAGTAYGAASSAFWTDWQAAHALLGYGSNVRVLMHQLTFNEIVANTVNAIAVTNQDGAQFTVRRYRTVGGNSVLSDDTRDTGNIVLYSEAGSVIDPADPTTTVEVPFIAPGKIIFIGNGARRGYRPGAGGDATIPGAEGLALGYTHIAPTVEGGGAPGRWGRVFSPEMKPWQLVGEGVTNLLPVIEQSNRIVVATTELA